MYVEQEQRAPAGWDALTPKERVALHVRVVALRPPRTGGEAAAMGYLAQENLREAVYALGLAMAGLAAGLAFDSVQLQLAFGAVLVVAAVTIPGYVVGRRR